MNGKESSDKESKKSNVESLELEKEDLVVATPESDDFIKISTKDYYIQNYGVNPAETPIFISYNAYRRIVGYALRYGRK